MFFHGGIMGFFLSLFVCLASLVLAVREDAPERYFDSGELPVDVVYSNKADGVTTRIPWDSSIFPTITFLKSVHADYGLDFGRLIFLIEDLRYDHEDPMKYGILITDDFDVNHGKYYHLVDRPFYSRDYRLVVDDKYDMTDKVSKHRTFVGALDENLGTMRKLFERHTPAYDAELLERIQRPSLNEEEMTDRDFLSDYARVRKGERDSHRDFVRHEKLERLEEEYHGRLPIGRVNPVTWEYINKLRQIEDEYLDSLELPERELVNSRPVDDEELWDSFEEGSTPEEGSVMHQTKPLIENWAEVALVEAIREHYIRPGEEFHIFAL